MPPRRPTRRSTPVVNARGGQRPRPARRRVLATVGADAAPRRRSATMNSSSSDGSRVVMCSTPAAASAGRAAAPSSPRRRTRSFGRRPRRCSRPRGPRRRAPRRASRRRTRNAASPRSTSRSTGLDDAPGAQHRDPVAHRFDLAQDVRRQQHGLAAVTSLEHALAEHLLHQRIETRRRLVEQQEVGPARRTRRSAAPSGGCRGCTRGSSCRASSSNRSTSSARYAASTDPWIAPRNSQRLRPRERRPQVRLARHVREPAVDRRRRRGDVEIEDRRPTGGRPDQSEQQPDRRRLPGAVRPEIAEDLTRARSRDRARRARWCGPYRFVSCSVCTIVVKPDSPLPRRGVARLRHTTSASGAPACHVSAVSIVKPPSRARRPHESSGCRRHRRDRAAVVAAPRRSRSRGSRADRPVGSRSPARGRHRRRARPRPSLAAVRNASPDAVVNLLTAIPRPRPAAHRREMAMTNRLRTEGTANLVAAAPGARFVSEGLAYAYDPTAERSPTRPGRCGRRSGRSARGRRASSSSSG